MKLALLVVLLFLAACATQPAPQSSTTLPMAPWNAHAAITAPPVLLTEWRKAENRATCAPLAFADSGTATPRRANFSGGWAVAFDMPGQPGRDASGHPCATCGRGAFGIAGAGIEKGPESDHANATAVMQFAGDNRVTYAPEGGTGPSWLANIHVDDQRCVYQVWSFLGRDHLEQLIRSIRRARME